MPGDEPTEPLLLPYSESCHTTLAAAVETRDVLAERFLPELARPIMSHGCNPWLANRRDEERQYRTKPTGRGTFNDYSIAGLYLTTEIIPTQMRNIIPQRIIFQTQAADQGWADNGGHGTFVNSHTWFEASILRPWSADGEDNGNKELPEGGQPDKWWDVTRAREDMRSRGWDFVEGEGGRLTWRVCNNLTACRRFRNYKVEWRRGVVTEVGDEKAVGKGEGFLELLTPGCVVALWARAEELNWVNKVAAATIEIEYEFL